MGVVGMMNMEILTFPIKFDKQKHVMIFLIMLWYYIKFTTYCP